MVVASAACSGGGSDSAATTARIVADAQTMLNDYWGALVTSDDAGALAHAIGPVRAQAEFRAILHRADPATAFPAGTSVSVHVTGVQTVLDDNRYRLNGEATLSLTGVAKPVVYKDFVVEDQDGDLKLVDYADPTGDTIASHCVLGEGLPPARAGALTAELVAGIWSGGAQTSVSFAVVLGGQGLATLGEQGSDATFVSTATTLSGPAPVFGARADGTEAYLTVAFAGAQFPDVAGGGTLRVRIAGTALDLAVPAFG